MARFMLLTETDTKTKLGVQRAYLIDEADQHLVNFIIVFKFSSYSVSLNQGTLLPLPRPYLPTG